MALPQGKTLEDKFAFGVYDDRVRLVGYLDLIRDSPQPAAWCLGLLMLEPEERASGLGGRIYRGAAEWVFGLGAGCIMLVVLERSPAARRFWERLGFREVRRQVSRSDTGRQNQVIVMRHGR